MEVQEEEEEEQRRLAGVVFKCEAALRENKYAYQTHVDYITALRQQGVVDKIRHARQKFSEAFPLTESLWLGWIRDEIAMAATASGAEKSAEKEKIATLFRRGTEDYLCPTLWREYAEFVSGLAAVEKADADEDDDDNNDEDDEDDDEEELNVEDGRKVYDAAIMACGQHVIEGRKVWTSYAKFEHRVLQDLEDGQAAAEVVAKQRGFIGSLYLRFMSVPLGDIDEALDEVNGWIAEFAIPVDAAALAARYKTAVTQINDKYTPLETALATAPAPRREAYESYIAAEKAAKDSRPDRMQIIYERAIVENAIDPSLWISYTAYTDEHLAAVTSKVHERAVRNVPWVPTVWANYIVATERQGAAHQSIIDIFEQCFAAASFGQAADYLELWMLRCEYIHRRVTAATAATGTPEGGAAAAGAAAGNDADADADDAVAGAVADRDRAVQEWRSTCNRASAYMLQYFGQHEGDPTARLLLYQARIEAGSLQNVDGARATLDKVLTAGYGKTASVAMAVASMQRHFGDEDACRKTFHKVVMLVSDYPDHVCEAAVTFEREVGTLEQLDAMRKRVAKRLSVVNDRREHFAAKQAEAAAKAAAKSAGKGKKRSRQASDAAATGGGGGGGGGGGAAAGDGDGDGGGKTDNRAAKRARKREEAGSEGRGGGTAADDDKVIERKEIDPSTYPRTAFISNLNFETDEEKLKSVLGGCGTIVEVRLNRKGPKRFAYVQFETAEAVTEALKLDRKDVDGRPMFVSKCVDKRANPDAVGHTFQHKTSLDQCTLFVKNLAFTCTEADIRAMFEPYGTLKDVRVPTTKLGKPKGFAYVEYTESKAAQKAIMQASGRSLKGRNVFVSISNPPARQSAPAPNATSSVNTTFRPRAMVRPRQAAQRPQNRKLKMGSVHMAAAAANNKPISMEDEVAPAGEGGAVEKEKQPEVKQQPKSNSFFADLFKK